MLILNSIKKYSKELIINIIFVGLQMVMQTVFVMSEMKKILSQGVEKQDMSAIMHSGIRMAVFTVIVGLFTVVASYVSAKLVAGTVCDIRRKCFDRVLSMDLKKYNQFGGSTMITRTITDVTQIQILVINMLRTSMMVPFLIIIMLAVIFGLNKVLFAVLLVFFAGTILFLVLNFMSSHIYFEKLQVLIDRISLFVKEKISGVRTIRAFGNQELEEEKFFGINKKTCEASIKANHKICFLAPISMIVMNWAVVVIYYLGTKQLREGLLQISDLILIFQYVGYFTASLAVVPMWVNLLPKVVAACKRIDEMLAFDSDEQGGGNGKSGCISRGEIQFKDVNFGYSGANNVISDVTFTAHAGKTTAFIGTTGSGKTTLMNLITGMYKVTSGQIRIDGTDINDMDSSYLRSRVSYGTQRAYVFQDTAYNNIAAYVQDCTKERVLSACHASAFEEVIDKMPDGLDTVMAQGGMNISGGQRQRMSIARTLCKDADIYILDDTLSALDAKTDQFVREQIPVFLEGKTVLMVAQKISAIKDADNIVVLDNGRIAGQGRHEQLLKECKEYQDIYATQVYKEERKEA